MELSDQSLTWLRLLGARTLTTDDWTSGLALGLMAAITPAWTERYVSLLDALIASHPETIIPSDPTSKIDGITDTEPGGFDHRARLLLLLGVRSWIDDDIRPFHAQLAEHVATELLDPLVGSRTDQDERSLSLAAAGLGLLLHDRRFGTDWHSNGQATRPAIALGDARTTDPSVRALTVLLTAAQIAEDAQDPIPDDALPREWGITGIADHLARFVAAPLAACPKVVDVDRAKLDLTRAEWLGGGLLLRLVTVEDDPTVWTTFRIVDAEPRLWYLTGIDRAWMDVNSSAVITRVPLVSGTLEFMPGSY